LVEASSSLLASTMIEKPAAPVGASSRMGVRVLLHEPNLGRAVTPERVGEGKVRRQYSAPTSPSLGVAPSSFRRLIRPEAISLSCLAPIRLAGDATVASGSKTSPVPTPFPGTELAPTLPQSGDTRRISKASGASLASSRSSTLRGREEEAVVYPGMEAWQHLSWERSSCGSGLADAEFPQASRSAQSLTPGRFRPIRSTKVMASAPLLPRRSAWSGAETERATCASARCTPASGHCPMEAGESLQSFQQFDSEGLKHFIEHHFRTILGDRLKEACHAMEDRLLQRLEDHSHLRGTLAERGEGQLVCEEQLVDGTAELKLRADAQAQQHGEVLNTLLRRVESIDALMGTVTAAQVCTDGSVDSLRASVNDLQEKVSALRGALSEERSDRLAGEKASAQGLEQISAAALKEAQARAKSNAVIEETIVEERAARGDEVNALRVQVQKLLDHATENRSTLSGSTSAHEVPTNGEALHLDRLINTVNEQIARFEQEQTSWSACEKHINERLEACIETTSQIPQLALRLNEAEAASTQQVEELRRELSQEVGEREAGNTRAEQACALLRAAFEEQSVELPEQMRGEARKLTLAVSREVKQERAARESCDQEVQERLKVLEEVYEDAFDLVRASAKAEPMKPRGSRIVGVDAAVQLRNSRTLTSVECL